MDRPLVLQVVPDLREAGAEAPARWTADGIDATALAAEKVAKGLTVSVCLPARDEAATIGPIVSAIRDVLVDGIGLVDEIVVLDDGSRDATARLAREAGARVVAASRVMAVFGVTLGKGDVLWRSLAASAGDIVVWCDSDLHDFDPSIIAGLVAPLVRCDTVDFVKGASSRPVDGLQHGGRVTELVARPLLALVRPDLAHLRQPLCGEYAGRRTLLESLPFETDYAVEIGLLLDIADLVGAHRIGEVDLGVRRHTSRPLADLTVQAASILRAVLDRCGVDAVGEGPWPLTLADGRDASVDRCVRPPMIDIERYLGIAR